MSEQPNIITIRGTSGSGKSHLVRAIMALYPVKEAIKVEGRKQPLYYILHHGPGSTQRPLAVLGHYETACGGCDTINTADQTFGLVKEQFEAGNDVIFEGLLLSGEIRRTKELGVPVHAMYLNTPLEVCLASVNARRAARGKVEPVDPANTTSKFKAVTSSFKRLAQEAPNVKGYMLDREQAFTQVKTILGL